MRDGYALTLSRVEAALHGNGTWSRSASPASRSTRGGWWPWTSAPAATARPDVVAEVARTGAAVRGAVLTLAQVTVTR